MKMIKPTTALIGLLMLCIGCKNSGNEKETQNGFKFTVVEKGDGIVGKPQQLLVFDYVIKDSEDSVWDNTYESGLPAVFAMQDTTSIRAESGMLQMFRLISVGDSVHIEEPAGVFFKQVWGGRPFEPGMDTTMTFTCDLRVREIMEMQKYQGFMDGTLAKRIPKQKLKDEKLLDEYLAKNNIKAEKDTSGVRYVMHANGGGRKPQVTDCVEVKYDGKLLGSAVSFDKNDKVAYPLSGFIPGWQLSVPKLGVGDSATFYIPSHLAYGAQGQRGVIPPDAILVFDITLLGTSSGCDQDKRICN
jgi:FKBP-type peptidyl-prolyl cis-trans isomerase